MKYIRTKDRVSRVDTKLSCKALYEYLIQFDNYKNDLVQTADTIEELCDVVVYVKEGYDNHVEHIKDFQNRNKKLFDKDLIVYGAIWVEGEHNEPIIKSVAKMKGVLPNGEIDWALL